MPVLARVTAILALALLSVCGKEGAGDSTTNLPSVTVSCVAAEHGYEVRFPEHWFTDNSGIAEPCRYFHPEPFTVETATEGTGVAVTVRLDGVSAEEVTPPGEESSPARTVERRATTVAGRAAVRVVTVTDGAAVRPEGTRAVSWFVDGPNGTIVATTSEAAAAGRYEDNVNVLDAMVQSLRVFEP